MKSNDSSKAPLPQVCGGGALLLDTIFCLDITIHLEIWETISYRETKLCRFQQISCFLLDRVFQHFNAFITEIVAAMLFKPESEQMS